jgi:cobalt-zinc-cadmium efflux system outer membrane protein
MKVLHGAPCASLHFLIAFALGAMPFRPGHGQETFDSARSELKRRIRAASPAVAARRAAVDVAQARRFATGLLPPAALSAEVEEVPRGFDVTGAQSMRVDVSRDLLPRGQRTAERSIADLDVRRAEIEVEIAGRSVELSVEELLLRAAGQAAIATRLASQDSLLRSAEDAVRARFAVADAPFVDVLRLRTERLRSENEQRIAIAEYHVARGQLLRLAPALAAELRPLVDATIAGDGERLMSGDWVALPPLDSLMAASAAQRLSVLAIERAQASQRLAQAERRPVISPSVGIQRFAGGSGGTDFGLTAGVSLTLPFTSRGATRARTTLADRELKLAQAERLATDAALSIALSAAAERYEVARVQIAAYDAALLRGAREEREAALAAYRTGRLSLLELIDFERALAQAEVSRLRSRIEAAEAMTRYLTAALGIPGPGGAR